SNGRLLSSVGDMRTPMYTRSALKPFQAMPLVAGFADQYALSDADIAVLCASHNGEAAHSTRVASLLKRAGRSDSDLQCGIHVPYYYTSNHLPPPEKGSYGRLQHNCSGKHAGMLMLANALGEPASTYTQRTHRVQEAIADSVAHFSGVASGKLVTGIDGCSVPNYAIPLPALAYAYSRLTRAEPDEIYGNAPMRIFQAMSQHAALVSGMGRNDLALNRAGAGDWIAKLGADGVQAIASRSRQTAITVKIADGDLPMLMLIVVTVLEQMGWMTDTARHALKSYVPGPLRNVAGHEVGHTTAVFQMS
ncbi:MAG: asparaginase, partial [Burkholderiaceae bacterium]|nr:asparaginase [Burkholderiaceae bacterium]